VTVNNAYFLGGGDEGEIMKVLKPHIFYETRKAIWSARRSPPLVL